VIRCANQELLWIVAAASVPMGQVNERRPDQRAPRSAKKPVAAEAVSAMDVPAHLRQYPCVDYFASEWATAGFFCEESQTEAIAPASQVETLPEVGFLSIGRAGVDGILFGYRTGVPGVWAYYPIGAEFEPVSPSVAELVRRWVAGEVRV
jgi:hypothetical protein